MIRECRKPYMMTDQNKIFATQNLLLHTFTSSLLTPSFLTIQLIDLRLRSNSRIAILGSFSLHQSLQPDDKDDEKIGIKDSKSQAQQGTLDWKSDLQILDYKSKLGFNNSCINITEPPITTEITSIRNYAVLPRRWFNPWSPEREMKKKTRAGNPNLKRGEKILTQRHFPVQSQCFTRTLVGDDWLGGWIWNSHLFHHNLINHIMDKTLQSAASLQHKCMYWGHVTTLHDDLDNHSFLIE